MGGRSELIVVGNGMVGHRLVELLISEGRTTDFRVTVIGEEPRPAYDRVGLSSFFAGKTAEDLSLVEPGSYERAGIEVRRDDRVTAIDRATKRVTLASGAVLALRQAGAGHRLVRLRAADRGPRRAGLLRLPHDRRPARRCRPTPRR